MKEYSPLTLPQRYEISALKKAGHTQQRIAQIVGVHRATISRELRATKAAIDTIPAPPTSRCNSDTVTNVGLINGRLAGVVRVKANRVFSGAPSRSVDGLFGIMVFRFRMHVFINIFAPTGRAVARCILICVTGIALVDRLQRRLTQPDLY